MALYKSGGYTRPGKILNVTGRIVPTPSRLDVLNADSDVGHWTLEIDYAKTIPVWGGGKSSSPDRSS